MIDMRLNANARMDPTVDNAVNRTRGTTRGAISSAGFQPFAALVRRIIQPGGGAAGSLRTNQEMTQGALTPAPQTQAQPVGRDGAIGTEKFASRASPQALRNASKEASALLAKGQGRSAGGLVADAEREETQE